MNERLTDAQLATLKAAINADPAFASLPINMDTTQIIADAFAAPASPSWTVWKTSIEVRSILENGFDWTLVDGLTQGKRDEWTWLTQYGSINPSKANVVAAINDVWKGTGAAMIAHRAAILTHCRRPANRGEKLFSTGTGSDASPATMTFEGNVFYLDVLLARNLP